MKFEAKLFQMKYKEMKQRKTVEEMCENNVSLDTIFCNLKTIYSYV